jgi:hypothetical protein
MRTVHRTGGTRPRALRGLHRREPRPDAPVPRRAPGALQRDNARVAGRVLMLVAGATASTPAYDVGILVVPKQWNHVDRLLRPGVPWACDNGCFAGFDEGAFVRMLERFHGRPGCLFVVAPDVVADAAATLIRWPFWSRLLHGLGYPVAFVAQDGITGDAVPWDELEALFLGGSTAYKESADAAGLAAYAKARGKLLHMGRVNSRRRLRIAARLGVDTYDGTGFSLAPDTNIPKGLRWTDDALERLRVQGDLL